MRQRLRCIIKKEFRQVLRNPQMRAMLVLPPLIQLLVFGYAVNLDVNHAQIAWMDEDKTQESRELLSQFEGSGLFEILATPTNTVEMQRLLDTSTVDGVVRVLPGFAKDLERGNSSAVQILLDGTDSNSAQLVSSYSAQAIGRYTAEVMDKRQRARLVAAGAPMSAAIPKVVAVPRVWFNPELKSRNYFVPGVIVNILMLVTLSLTTMAIVREKEIGTMEQLMVTPIRPSELILGKTLPFVAIGFWDLLLVMSAALLIFRVPFQGNFGLLCFASFLFILTNLGAGLLISTISKTQQQANMATFLLFQPFMMLSGFSFPIRSMPEAIQWFTYINPMRYFLEIVRGIFLKGSGIDILWPNLLALAVFGVTILSISVMRFHKTLE
ncbi:MAG: ABC transporter permease [Bryobacteraceae bacterium]